MSNTPTLPDTDRPQTEADIDRLYRMSKTAGAGSAEYVAINATAIFALVMGLASLLAALEPIFLIFPLIALVASGVALRQIHKSAGTQGGVWLATLGLCLGLGVTSFVVTRFAADARRVAGERQEIIALVDRFGQLILDRQFEQAYESLFDASFRERIPFSRFDVQMDRISQNPISGQLRRIRTGNRFDIMTHPATGRRQAATMIVFEVERGEPQYVEGRFVLRGDEWIFLDIPWMFPTERRPEHQGPPPGTEPPSGLPGIPGGGF